MHKPELSWSDYLDTFPKGRLPKPEDMFLRWEEFEPRSNPQFPEREPVKARKNVGERNVYEAWLGEMMEDEEASFFEHTIMREDTLMRLAVVPAVRFCAGFLAREVESIGRQVTDMKTMLMLHDGRIDNAGGKVSQIDEQGLKPLSDRLTRIEHLLASMGMGTEVPK